MCSRETALATSLAFFLLLPGQPGATSVDDLQRQRMAIDEMAEDALDNLFVEREDAAVLYANAYGYAVFDKLKISSTDSPGGVGVLVENESGHRMYMDLGTAGIYFGQGVYLYQVIFFFETETSFRDFESHGTRAQSSRRGSSLDSADEPIEPYLDGVAFYYQVTGEGTVSAPGYGGTPQKISDMNWKNRPAPTCRPRAQKWLNKD